MMGDIVRTESDFVELVVEVAAQAPIERIEFRNGMETLESFRTYVKEDLGSRIRVIWSGAEYSGRGRQTSWVGRTRFIGAEVQRISKIKAWNHERRMEQTSTDTDEWDAITTGNDGGVDERVIE